MLHSLRFRLLAGFGVVIVLTLLLASLGAVWMLRDQQTEFAEQSYGRLVVLFASRAQQMELIGWPPSRIREELVEPARYYDIRILLVDRDGRVIADTDDSEDMLDMRLDSADGRSTAFDTEGGMISFFSWRANAEERDLYLFTAAEPAPVVPAFVPMREPEARLVLAVPAGDVTSVWAALLPRLAPAGAVAALLGVLMASVLASRITRPITQMTRASEAMTRGQYEQRIEAQGTDEVAQLAHAFNEMAGEVHRSQRAMRQLMANVSHDLKTPLTSIQGFSQAMLDGLARDPEERRELARVIYDEASHMSGMVEDLLYLSRIESGELALQLDDVELDALLSATAGRFRYQAETSDVALRLSANGGVVRADERRLEQVCANLLDNAIRFAPAGTEVLLASRSEGASVVVEVHNAGEPIPAQDLPHVFDRFYQGDPARGGGHAGLGLAIVQELVQAHGGDVSVRSNAAAGTTFTVRLPRNGPPETAPQQPNGPSEPVEERRWVT